jgi:glycine cleavage system H protein
LPKAGRTVAAGEACAVVESVKAASDVYAPLAGEIVAGNEGLAAAPEAVNEDAYASWLFRIRPANAADVEQFLDAAAYSRLVAQS